MKLPMETVFRDATDQWGYAALGLVLLICGVFLTIISGGVESMQSATITSPSFEGRNETQDRNIAMWIAEMTDEECK